MKTVKGDLIQLTKLGKFDVILHGCNCWNMMGGGIALQIAKEFPLAQSIDNSTIKGDINKLGTFTRVPITIINRQKGEKIIDVEILNCYTQYNGGSNFHLPSLQTILKKVNHLYRGKKIGLPQIGCGIGGGNWNEVKYHIQNILTDCDVTIVEFQQTPTKPYKTVNSTKSAGVSKKVIESGSIGRMTLFGQETDLEMTLQVQDNRKRTSKGELIPTTDEPTIRRAKK